MFFVAPDHTPNLSRCQKAKYVYASLTGRVHLIEKVHSPQLGGHPSQEI